MTLRLNGSTSGYTEIDAPASAGNNTLVLPGGNGTDAQVLATNGSGTLSWVNRWRHQWSTPQASTSGTEVDFTDAPSWAKKITVMIQSVSTSSTVSPGLQLRIASGPVTSGYVGASGTRSGETAYSTDFRFFGVTSAASASVSGQIVLTKESESSNIWYESHIMGLAGTGATVFGAGFVNLNATLTGVRLISNAGNFDAGSIQVLYEG